MRILFVCSEAYPLVKTGGLGDVCASLPQALRAQGEDVHLVLPGYPAALAGVEDVVVTPGAPGAAWRLVSGRMPGTDLPVHLIDWPDYFGRAGDPYRGPDGSDWPDNPQRFSAFARAVIALATGSAGYPWKPDVLHLNDWQTGLVGALLADHPRRPPVVFTIHNLAYQGLFPGSARFHLGIPAAHWSPEGLEYHGQLSFIKGGLAYADAITTVSPTYAREIQAEPLGMGLEGLLRARADRLHGILNGVDYEEWDPAHDRHLPARYTVDDLSGKARNKHSLQKELGLPQSSGQPLLAFVGRMVEQKGIDLILDACAPLLAAGQIQLVLVGTGQAEFEAAARSLAEAYPKQCCARIAYDEGLAHRVEAGVDLFLTPSRFEPCGMNQMYSLRYGTPPIVHATGGLADTIVAMADSTTDSTTDSRAETWNLATGFLFTPATSEALSRAIAQALDVYRNPDQGVWLQLIRNGMRADFSWNQSAKLYRELYRELYQSHLNQQNPQGPRNHEDPQGHQDPQDPRNQQSPQNQKDPRDPQKQHSPQNQKDPRDPQNRKNPRNRPNKQHPKNRQTPKSLQTPLTPKA